MNKEKTTVTLFFDTRRKKKDGKFPVKLNIYHDGEKRRYNTNVDLDEAEWAKINSEKLRDDNLRMTRRRLNIGIEKANSVLDKLEQFSFEGFEEIYFGKKQAQLDTLEYLFNEKIMELEKEDRNGSVEVYRCAQKSFLKYAVALKIRDITTDFLKGYEKAMTDDGASASTIGIYLRHLRAIVNIAIKKGLLPIERYPFRDYRIPCSRNVKKALPIDDIKKILHYRTDNQERMKAVDFWVYSYLCNGMNMKDICLLKWETLGNEFFSFMRAKTINTKKHDLRPIKVPFTDRAKQIVEQYGVKGGKYVFPVVQEHWSMRQIDKAVEHFIRSINHYMENVRKELGIEQPLNTYAARHSHATLLKRKGVSIEAISENLGHSNLLSTARYLDDFTDDTKLENANLLIDL